MNDKKRLKIASRGKRLAAFAIDEIIPVLIGSSMLVGLLGTATMSYSYYGYGYGYNSYSSNGLGNGLGIGHVFGAFASVLILLVYLGVQFYFYSKSQTIGKALIGTKVVSSKTGEPIGFPMMLLRELIVKQASKAVFCLGYIWVLIDERSRAWHDKILDTYVIDIKESELLNKPENEPTEVAVEPASVMEPVEATEIQVAQPVEVAHPIEEVVAEPVEADPEI